MGKLTTIPNFSADFFAFPDSDDGEVRQVFLAYEASNGTFYLPDRCKAKTESGDWSCNYSEGHAGHHDAWMEGVGTHLAHWLNKDVFVIKEEEELFP